MNKLFTDVLMIFGLGVVFVTIYIEKRGKEAARELGFTNRKWILRKWRRRLNVIENINSDPGNAQEG